MTVFFSSAVENLLKYLVFLCNDNFDVIITSSNIRRNLTHKEVVVAGDLVENFVRLAQINTNRNVETCGILCGSLVSFKSVSCYFFYDTHYQFL